MTSCTVDAVDVMDAPLGDSQPWGAEMDDDPTDEVAGGAHGADQAADGVLTPVDDCNEVRIRGRLAADPETRELPSGDEIVTFRLVVKRAGVAARPDSQNVRRTKVDSLACVAWDEALRTKVRDWHKDDVVEAVGALRRRFWRAAGNASFHEIEVSDVTCFGPRP